jgi:hypothetical protein
MNVMTNKLKNNFKIDSKKLLLSCSEITSQKLLTKVFPDINISNILFKVPEHHFDVNDKLFSWLEAVGDDLVTSEIIKLDNESSIYPLIFAFLKVVVEIENTQNVDNKLLMLSKTKDIYDEQVVEKVCDDFAEVRFTNSLDSDDEEFDTDRLEQEAKLSFDIHQLYLAIEKQLKESENDNGGRVEFALIETKTDRITCVVEAKFCIFNDKEKGLWQTCAEMIMANNNNNDNIEESGKKSEVVFGVYTDYDSWRFLIMENKTIRFSKTFYLCERTGEFHKDIYSILKFLFLIVNIPIDSLDLIEIEKNIKNSKKLKKEKLFQQLHNLRNIKSLKSTLKTVKIELKEKDVKLAEKDVMLAEKGVKLAELEKENKRLQSLNSF